MNVKNIISSMVIATVSFLSLHTMPTGTDHAAIALFEQQAQALQNACRQGDVTTAEKILQQAGNKARNLIFSRDNSGQNSLNHAIGGNDTLRLVDLLIRYIGNYAYELITTIDNARVTPWYYVVRMGDLALVQKFIQIAAQRSLVWDLIARREGDSGWTPLHWAVVLKHKAIIEYLVLIAGKRAHELILKPNYAGQSALDWCSLDHNDPVIKKILHDALYAQLRCGEEDRSKDLIRLLYSACQNGDCGAAEVILKNAGETAHKLIFTRDSAGYMPLNYALYGKDSKELVCLFIKYAGDRAYELITATDNINLTLWYHAIEFTDVDVVTEFIHVAEQHNAVWELISKKEGCAGWTPLHHAAVYNKKALAEYLVKLADKKASKLILMPGFAKETPLDWARRQKNHEIVMMFEKALQG